MPTPEALAFAEQHGSTVTCEVTLAILLDRFAAQRGAEPWLPIETAPKDGTRIVLTDGDVPVVGLWRAHDEQWIVDWDHKPYQDSPRETPATRWMPLPSNKAGAPPQTGGGSIAGGGDRYRHKKRGTTYQVIGVASSQVVGEPIGEGGTVVVYRAENGPPWDLWVRPYDEFHDGRFEYIGGPQTGGGDAGERPSELRLVGIQNGAYSHSTADDTIPFLLSVIEYDRKRLRSSHREGAEAISDDMNAAHWHGYREGAEAMRELCKTCVDPNQTAQEQYDAMDALPIPGK